MNGRPLEYNKVRYTALLCAVRAIQREIDSTLKEIRLHQPWFAERVVDQCCKCGTWNCTACDTMKCSNCEYEGWNE